MARVLGYVKSFDDGIFFVKNAKGQVHQLKVGEAVHEDELVYGAKNNPSHAKIVIDVTLANAGDLVISGNGALNFDTSLLKGVFSHDDAVVYVNSLKEALATVANTETRLDPIANEIIAADKTAAGDETAAGEAVNDTERSGDTFAERDGLVGDVRTVLAEGTNALGTTNLQTDGNLIVDLNDAPVAVDILISTDEDQPFSGILPIATDADGDTPIYSLSAQAANGVVVINPDGSYNYTPNENYNGNDTFSYTVSDVNGGNNTYTVAVEVAPVNDAPTTTPVTLTAIPEDSGARIITQAELLGNASDVESNVLSVSNVSISSGNGVLVDYGNGTWSYTPANNDDTSVSFSYTITDNGTTNGASDPKSVTGSATLDITPVADMPILTLISKEYGLTTYVEEMEFTGTYKSVDVSSLNGGIWHTDNSGGTVEVGYSSTYGVNGNKNKVLELERNPGDPSNLYTTMDVKAGEVYALSFDYANRSGDTSDMSVYWNGQLVAVINPSSTTLTPYTINLISEITGTGKLELKANDFNSIGVVLDNIVLNLVPNTGYAGYLANLPAIEAGLTDSSETLTVTIAGIPAGYSLTDGINTASTSTVDISGWNSAALSLIAPSDTGATTVQLTVDATSTESDGISTTKSQVIDVTILADTTGYFGSRSNDILTGNDSANTLWGLDGDDRLDGSNGRDSLIGGGGNDNLITDFGTISSSLSGDYVMDGGTGIDTLIFDQNNTSINFTILNSMNNPINNIEIIDLEQDGSSTKQTLSNLSVQDVIDMTDANNTLTILRDASDTVNIPSATGAYSVSTDSTSEAGFDIYTYTSTNASDPTVVLKIDSDI